MLNTTRTVAILAALCALASAQTAAPGEVVVRMERDGKGVPQKMNLQGYLTDDQGNPINGVRSMQFRVYSGSNVQWQETQACSVNSGLFAVTLGNVTPMPESVFAPGTARELELVVEGQTLSPRVAVTSVGFAFRANTVSRPLSPGIGEVEIADRAVTMAKISDYGTVQGYVIKWNGFNWQPMPDSAGGGVSGPAGGDLYGTYPNPSVGGLRGRDISTTTPYDYDLLSYDGTRWGPLEPGGDIDGEINAIKVVGLQGREISTTTPYDYDLLSYDGFRWSPLEPGGDIDGEINAISVVGLQGRSVYNTSPSTGEVLTWYSSRWEPRPLGGDVSGYAYDLDVTGLQGRPVSTSSPSTGNVLTWYSSQWTPRPLPAQDEFGSVRLADGAARVTLSTDMAARAGGRFYVFVQQTRGEPVQVVVRKHEDWFELVGPAGSSAEFDFRVSAGGGQ